MKVKIAASRIKGEGVRLQSVPRMIQGEGAMVHSVPRRVRDGYSESVRIQCVPRRVPREYLKVQKAPRRIHGDDVNAQIGHQEETGGGRENPKDPQKRTKRGHVSQKGNPDPPGYAGKIYDIPNSDI